MGLLLNRTLAITPTCAPTLEEIDKFLKKGGTVLYSKGGLRIHGRFSASKTDVLAFFGNEKAAKKLETRRTEGRQIVASTLAKMLGDRDGGECLERIFPNAKSKISRQGLSECNLSRLASEINESVDGACEVLKNTYGVREDDKTWDAMKNSMALVASRIPADQWHDEDNFKRVLIREGIVETFRQQIISNTGKPLTAGASASLNKYMGELFSKEDCDPKSIYDVGKRFYPGRVDADTSLFQKEIDTATAMEIPHQEVADDFVKALGLDKTIALDSFLRMDLKPGTPGYTGWNAFVGHGKASVLAKMNDVLETESGNQAFESVMEAIFGGSAGVRDPETRAKELSEEFCKLLAVGHSAIENRKGADFLHTTLDGVFALRVISSLLLSVPKDGELRKAINGFQSSIAVKTDGSFGKIGPWTERYYELMTYARRRGDELLKAEETVANPQALSTATQ